MVGGVVGVLLQAGAADVERRAVPRPRLGLQPRRGRGLPGGTSSLFVATKIEPEDFGPTSRIWGAFRTVTRDVLAEMGLASVSALSWHQAGRAESASNYRPPCYNASAVGPAGPGSYAACRIEGYAALLDVQKAGGAQLIGVSNYGVRDLQQLHDALGVWCVRGRAVACVISEL